MHGFASIAVAMCMLLSALTALVATAPSVEAEEPAIVYRIGVTEQPDSFNPFDMMAGTSWSVAHMMYEFLYAVGPKMDPYPQLAASHEYSDDYLTWTFHLVEDSYWHDGYPVTAHDVEFTFNMILDYPRECALMADYLENVVKVTATDEYTVRIELEAPKANMLGLIIPILPEHRWTKVRDGDVGINRVDMFDQEYFPDGPVGSGPFILNEYSQAQGYISLLAQKPYHRLPDIEVDSVNIDELLFIIYKNANAMVTDLEIGNIDAVGGVPSLSWDTLMENPDIEGQTPATHILEEFGFNCAPPEIRESVNETTLERNFPDASTNYETCNVKVRQAMAMATDIPYIADEIHLGRAQEAYAIIPPATPFWHYAVPEEDKWHNYGIEGANALLDESGYGEFDNDGVRMNETNGARLEFEFYYIRSILMDELTAQKMQEWWKQIGVKVNLHAAAEGILYNLEFEMEYDMFIWSWWPDVDPTWFLSVLTTGQIPLDNSDNTKWSDAFYTNPYYDQLWLEQQQTMDIFERQAIVHEMQQIVYRDCPYICLVYPAGLIAYRTDNWENVPDMEISSGITPSSFWYYFEIEPKGVPAFDIGLAPSYEVQRGQNTPFSVMIHDSDGDPLEVTWTFGDGSDEVSQTFTTGTDTSFEASVTHSYDTLANDLVLKVSVTDGTYVRNNTASVDVVTLANSVPTISDPSCSPSEAYIGETTTWSITASDAEETELTVTWDWNDGSFTTTTETASAPGEPINIELTHVFDNPGDYDVTVWVNDGYDAPGHNNSFTFATYSVVGNSPPYALTVADTATNVDIWTSLSATARDADPDTLQFTWEWDDGTFNVTEYDTSSNPNAVVIDDVWHMWDTPDTYSVTVWVDDLTGEPGHNISSTVEVVVSLDGDLPPSSIQLIADPDPAVQGQPVEIIVRAADGNGDALTITVEFGDGENYTDSTVGGTMGPQSILVVHTYVDVDTYTVTAHVDDGTFNVSKTRELLVGEPPENSPPSIKLAGSYSAMYNETFTITPMVISDADGDDLTVWYDWGDGSPMTEGDVDYAASHEYHEVAIFTLKAYVDDGIPEPDHNVSATAQVTVGSNLKPTINELPKYSPTENTTVGVEITFTVNVSDPEGDPMVVKIIFGDSQNVNEETVNNMGSSENFTVTLTHTYTASGKFDVKVWVEDDKDHEDPAWSERTLTLTIDPIQDDEDDDGGLSTVAIAAIGLLAIIAAVAVAVLLLKRKKGSEPELPEDESSPEQMAEPPPPEPPEA